jgi:ssDNA-binding Zn-finger/Zn-ribbon topoisomerase 1
MAEQLPDNMTTELTCPQCGGRLIVKTAKTTQHQFLGCELFRETGCGYTQAIPEGLLMKLAGYPTLPGLD